MTRVVVYSPYPETHACAHIRIAAPMRTAGWEVVWAKRPGDARQPFDVAAARRADLIVIQRQFPSARTEGLLKALLQGAAPVVYDLDDMLLGIPPAHPSSAELGRRAPFIRWALNEVDLVTASTAPLGRALARETTRPVRVQPNLVDWVLFEAPPRSRDRPFRFLVSGTSTHRDDWAILEEPLAEVLAQHAGTARAVFFGEVPARFAGNPGVDAIGFEDDYRRYAARLRTLDVHAALAPLEDTEFNRCKSDIKWLEYAAAGVPGAYSDVQPYRASIEHERTGLLVPNTPEAWFDAMTRLIRDAELARSLAEQAQRHVRDACSIDKAGAEHVAVYAELLGSKERRSLAGGVSTFAARIAERARDALRLKGGASGRSRGDR